MSVNLQKTQMRLCNVICSPYCQTIVEGDVIVPDIKPDIKKILQVNNNVVVNQKNVQNDKIYIQGTVKINILYTPDGYEGMAVRSISTTQEFNHALDIKGAKPGMELWVDASVDPAEFTLVNSRKLNIRSRVGLSARLSGMNEIEIATGIDDSNNIELCGCMLSLYNPRIDEVRDIIIRERLEVPAGKPAICEILKSSANPRLTELTLATDKAIIKGELKICTLYCGDEITLPQVMEHTIPFDEVLEIAGLTEGMNGEVDFCLKDLIFEICQDSDGDKRILSCEFTIETEIRAYETLECAAIEDAYGLKQTVQLKRETYSIEKMLGSITTQITANESVGVPDYLPEISCLCDCTAVPVIENVSINDNSVTVTGYMTCNILYLADDEELPVSGFAHILPFSHCFDMPGITPDAVCDTKAEVEHIGCTINNEKSLQLRAIISLNMKAVKPESIELVSDISFDNAEPLPSLPSATIYYVQKGDTLWNVSKKYRIPQERIIAENGDEN
jgi:hypothetical protein